MLHRFFRRRRIGDFRVRPDPASLGDRDREAVERFVELYYRRWAEGGGTIDLAWLGYKTLKCPLDLWVYQELIVELGVTLVIECGTRFGGSAYFLACLFDLVGRGRVITIDTGNPGNADLDGTKRPLPQHPRLRYLTGSSVDSAVVAQISAEIDRKDVVLVILDSDHRRDHVLAELRTYAPLVTRGSYIVVEDTNINGHPVLPDFGPGPWEAVQAFLAENHAFVSDEGRERFLLTLNPRGYLRRIS